MNILPTGEDNGTIDLPSEPNSDIQALHSTLSFLKSVILSGEPYTAEVSIAFENAHLRLDILDRLLGNREKRNGTV